MKTKQFTTFLSLLIMIALFWAACSGEPREDIYGFWVVEDVQADADTSQISPDVLDKTLDMYRAINFEFRENDSMNLISEGGVHPGTWEYKDGEAAVYISMEGSSIPEPLKFADYKDGKLINTNNTRIGTIVVTYVKQ
jgi:hypothetical protein